MPSHPLSRLDTDRQQYVSACCRDFHSRLQQYAPHLLEEHIQKAPGDARFALLCELLPIEIEHVKLRIGRLPTLHELCHSHPKLKEYLPKAYAWVPRELRLPDALGRYKVLKVLGEGGQGCVVQARDELDDRLVAVKYAAQSVHVSLLRREQMFLSQLAHKNIIEVLGAGDEAGVFYVILPLRRGESLQLVFGQHRPAPALAAEVMLQIARAIAHMHAQNVVHRDIKPGNIHLDPQSPVETVVLLDLGMAVDVTAWNAEDRRILEHGGTKAYMAPEQLASDESSDPKLSDVFALGAVLYFLLVGEPPLDRALAPQLLRRAAAPNRLKKICRQALETRPALRQASAAQLAADLERFLTDRSARRVLARLAIPVVPALAVATATFLWMGAKETDVSTGLPPGEELWVERTAQELGINLDEITERDFQVTFEPDDSYAHMSRMQGDDTAKAVRIIVRPSERTEEFMGEVEYRIGNRPWRNLLTNVIDGSYYNMLDRRDLEVDGPVELRIDSLRSSGSGRVWGPYKYDLYVSTELETKGREAASQLALLWLSPKEQWVEYNNRRWRLREHLQFLVPSQVKAIQLGPDPKKFSSTLLLGEGVDYYANSAALPRTFLETAAPYRDADALYVRLVFPDGSFSATREFRRPKGSSVDDEFE